jgi:N-acyl-D-aspartate/D-glutamate deacylase
MFDLVIRGGMVFDGTGAEGILADVGISGGVVVDVGKVSDSAAKEIDASGHFVTPGFIDGHTHLDAQIFWDPYVGSLSKHGVTSAVMGNCGFTLAPGTADDADLILRSIERAEDMSRSAIEKGVPWTWSSFGEFVTAVKELPKALNIAVQIGHSALRASVMGERAFGGTATDAEVAEMCRRVADAIRAGATGFSTSRSRAHLTKSGEPVASRSAPWSEVEAIVMAMAREKAGLLQLAPERPEDPAALSDYQARLTALATRSGLPVTFMVGGQDEQLGTVRNVVASGGKAIGQVHVRGFENIFGFKTHLPFDGLPLWQSVRSKTLDEQSVRLRDPALRRRLVEEAVNGVYGEGVGAEIRAPRYEEITVLTMNGDASLTALAAAKRISPVEVMIDLSLETNFEQLFRQPISESSDEFVLAALNHPHTVVAASDSGAHISQILDSNIPTYFLAHWVRDRGLFSWPRAINMLTGLPASVWGFHDRGVLVSGSVADIAVFDPETVASGLPRVVNDLPDGSARLDQPAVGIRATIVNGQVVRFDGDPSGDTPGRLIEGARWSPST